MSLTPWQRKWLPAAVVTLPLLLLLGILVTMSVTGDAEVRGADVEEITPGRPEASLVPTEPTPTPKPTPTTTPPCTPGPPVALRVVSFNIHGARGRSGLDLPGIAAELRALSPDVVLLQEVDRFRARSRGVDQPAHLARALGMGHVFAPLVTGTHRSRGAARWEYGTAILSRHPVTDHHLTHLPQPPDTEARGLLRVGIEVGHHTVNVYNTHLQHNSASTRTAQAQAIQRVLDAERGPVVLGGDLNAVPGSDVHSLLTTGLNDVWNVAGRGAGGTSPARSPRRRIDYVLTSPDITVTQAATHTTAISDHRAVRADLALAGLPCD